MRLRRWTAVVAMLGVLLHALALVRHHGIMLDAQLLDQALAAGVSFCHGGPDAASDAGVPGTPKPSDPRSSCPICAGQAPAFALLAAGQPTVPLRFAVMARWFEPERSHPALRHAVCPPSRGPPSQALSA